MRPAALALPFVALLLAGQAADRPLEVYWAKGGARMRIEMNNERSLVVLDRDTGQMLMVLLDRQDYLEASYDPPRATGFTLPLDVPLTRGRTEVVAPPSGSRELDITRSARETRKP